MTDKWRFHPGTRGTLHTFEDNGNETYWPTLIRHQVVSSPAQNFVDLGVRGFSCLESHQNFLRRILGHILKVDGVQILGAQPQEDSSAIAKWKEFYSVQELCRYSSVRFFQVETCRSSEIRTRQKWKMSYKASNLINQLFCVTYLAFSSSLSSRSCCPSTGAYTRFQINTRKLACSTRAT